jgi:hypothetical protein
MAIRFAPRQNTLPGLWISRLEGNIDAGYVTQAMR